jgi:hypothetical protein
MTPQLFTMQLSDMGEPQLVPYPPMVGNDLGGQQGYYVQRTGQTDATSLNDYANALGELASLHNTLLVSGQLIATGVAGEPQPTPISTIRKPWLDAPDNAVPFDEAASALLPAVAALATVVTFTVPDGMDGVITAYSWNFVGGGFVQGNGDLIAQVTRNGAAVRNYSNILVEKGNIAIPRPIAPLRLYSGDVIALTIFHAANALLIGNVVASFVGYFYPSQS